MLGRFLIRMHPRRTGDSVLEIERIELDAVTSNLSCDCLWNSSRPVNWAREVQRDRANPPFPGEAVALESLIFLSVPEVQTATIRLLLRTTPGEEHLKKRKEPENGDAPSAGSPYFMVWRAHRSVFPFARKRDLIRRLGEGSPESAEPGLLPR